MSWLTGAGRRCRRSESPPGSAPLARRSALPASRAPGTRRGRASTASSAVAAGPASAAAGSRLEPAGRCDPITGSASSDNALRSRARHRARLALGIGRPPDQERGGRHILRRRQHEAVRVGLIAEQSCVLVDGVRTSNGEGVDLEIGAARQLERCAELGEQVADVKRRRGLARRRPLQRDAGRRELPLRDLVERRARSRSCRQGSAADDLRSPTGELLVWVSVAKPSVPSVILAFLIRIRSLARLIAPDRSGAGRAPPVDQVAQPDHFAQPDPERDAAHRGRLAAAPSSSSRRPTRAGSRKASRGKGHMRGVRRSTDSVPIGSRPKKRKRRYTLIHLRQRGARERSCGTGVTREHPVEHRTTFPWVKS